LAANMSEATATNSLHTLIIAPDSKGSETEISRRWPIKLWLRCYSLQIRNLQDTFRYTYGATTVRRTKTEGNRMRKVRAAARLLVPPILLQVARRKVLFEGLSRGESIVPTTAGI
jgi:hypothetical protein